MFQLQMMLREVRLLEPFRLDKTSQPLLFSNLHVVHQLHHSSDPS